MHLNFLASQVLPGCFLYCMCPERCPYRLAVLSVGNSAMSPMHTAPKEVQSGKKEKGLTQNVGSFIVFYLLGQVF